MVWSVTFLAFKRLHSPVLFARRIQLVSRPVVTVPTGNAFEALSPCESAFDSEGCPPGLAGNDDGAFRSPRHVFTVFHLPKLYLPHIGLGIVSSPQFPMISSVLHLLQVRSGRWLNLMSRGVTRMASGRLQVSYIVVDAE